MKCISSYNIRQLWFFKGEFAICTNYEFLCDHLERVVESLFISIGGPEGWTAIGIKCTRLWNYVELFWNSPLHLLSSTWKWKWKWKLVYTILGRVSPHGWSCLFYEYILFSLNDNFLKVGVRLDEMSETFDESFKNNTGKTLYFYKNGCICCFEVLSVSRVHSQALKSLMKSLSFYLDKS